MHDETALAHLGRDPERFDGVVNPPVYRASTVLFPSLAALEAASRQPFTGTYYGRFGTPTTFALEEAMAALEGAHRAVAVESGLAAITTTLLAFLTPGDHLLMVDTVYGPTRLFCDGFLARLGVSTTYYSPALGTDIAALIRPETRLIFTESPGSLTFEVQDLPAICQVAHARGIPVALDNTWATPLYFKAFDHGVDVSIHAATKYVVGHADAMLGVINVAAAHYERIKKTAVALGHCAGSEECALGLRGLRTLAVRLARHQATALTLIDWLSARPEVRRVRYPAWPQDRTMPCGGGIFAAPAGCLPSRWRRARPRRWLRSSTACGCSAWATVGAALRACCCRCIPNTRARPRRGRRPALAAHPCGPRGAGGSHCRPGGRIQRWHRAGGAARG